jgi:hypothetical protein
LSDSDSSSRRQAASLHYLWICSKLYVTPNEIGIQRCNASTLHKERHHPTDHGGNMNGHNTYAERNTVPDIGEQLFEQYCKEKNYRVFRLGFDSKKTAIDNFYKINAMLRNIPDYIVETPKTNFIVQVKGTANIKKKEVEMIPLFLEWYSCKDAPLVYAFCFAGAKPKLIYAEKVIELYKQSVDKVWPDGVIYRSLQI